MNNTHYTDPNFERLFAQINPQIASTFTDKQIEALKRSFTYKKSSNSFLDIRLSIPVPRLRFYIVFLAGVERRSQKRLRSEKGLYPFWTLSNSLFIIGFAIILSISTFTIFSFVLSSLNFTSTLYYPTSIPWIYEKSQCERTNRVWRDDKCWDYEHSPDF
ncbi:hypothetical protein [Nostoc sp. CCY0012]|uniref:hypothetical protein n=1 Tax=Nostoc sp. CCY0012 TaxID=1056123 RepID=UPI0039C6345F